MLLDPLVRWIIFLLTIFVAYIFSTTKNRFRGVARLVLGACSLLIGFQVLVYVISSVAGGS